MKMKMKTKMKKKMKWKQYQANEEGIIHGIIDIKFACTSVISFDYEIFTNIELRQKKQKGQIIKSVLHLNRTWDCMDGKLTSLRIILQKTDDEIENESRENENVRRWWIVNGKMADEKKRENGRKWKWRRRTRRRN